MRAQPVLKSSPDSLGRQRVYIRLTDKSKRKYFRTNIMVAAGDLVNGSVKTSNPRHKVLNNAIKAAMLTVEYNSFFGKATTDKDFFAYCEECFAQWKNLKKITTYKKYLFNIDKVKGFTNSLKLSQITPEWLQSYSDYCYSLGNQRNTVWTAFKFIRLIIRKAYKEKLIELNPFDLFDMPRYRDPQRIYLTREQVGEIEKYVNKKNTPAELKFIGTWFLISCWTGLRFSDCAAFNKNKIKSGRLVLYTQKTHDIISIPVSPKLKKLFESINYRPLDLTNEYCNRMIKIIAKCAEIEENISWHTSRHTAATMMASVGIRQEVIARILGHADLRSTAIYMRLTNPTIDKELEKMR